MTSQLPDAPQGVTPDQWFRAIAVMAAVETGARTMLTIQQNAERLALYIKTGEPRGY
jgi:hypothetical protein